MKPFLILPAFILLLAFTGCDKVIESASSADSAAIPESTTGSVSSSFQAALRGTWSYGLDSIRIELRHDDEVRIITGPIDSMLTLDSLVPGTWTARIGLFAANVSNSDFSDGMWAEDTLEVRAGEAILLDPPLERAYLHRAPSFELESLYDDSLAQPESLAGTWHLRSWTGYDSLPTTTSLTLFRSGFFVGFDGTDSFPGSWGIASNGKISFSRIYLHPWPELDQPLSFGEAGGLQLLKNASFSCVGGLLNLGAATDSTRGTFARTTGSVAQTIHPRHIALLEPTIPDSTTDTTALHLASATLVRVDSTSAYAILTIQASHPGIEIRLLSVEHQHMAQTGGCEPDSNGLLLCWDGLVLVPQKILVVGTDDPGAFYSQVMSTVQVAVPWTALDANIDFVDRSGKTISVSH